MAGKLTEKVNNDNKSAFEQAIISKDHGSTKEININAQEKQSILKKLVDMSTAEDGQLALWIIENFDEEEIGDKMNEDYIIQTTIYDNLKRYWKDADTCKNKISDLKTQLGVEDELISDICIYLLNNRLFTMRMLGSEYIALADTFIREPEEVKELHVHVIDYFMGGCSFGTMQCIRQVIDHYNLSKEDIRKFKSEWPHDFKTELLEHASKTISKKSFEYLIKIFPEYEQEIRESVLKGLPNNFITWSIERFEKCWDLYQHLNEDKELSKRELVKKNIKYYLEKGKNDVALEYLQKYKQKLEIDDNKQKKMTLILKYEGNKPDHKDLKSKKFIDLNWYTIGRDCIVDYEDLESNPKSLSLSRQHAIIYVTEEGIFLEDLGSKVGTYVNGVKIGEDFALIHPDWKQRDYKEDDQRIRDVNSGITQIFPDDIIELGIEMFPGVHKYRLNSLDEAVEKISAEKLNESHQIENSTKEKQTFIQKIFEYFKKNVIN